jgi:RNA polymerase sigma factor (sigma-70 family)
MEQADTFDDLMARLRVGDDRAAAEVHRRYAHRLIVLAHRQFDSWVRDRADPEDVVQSVFKSFFARYERGQLALNDWGDIWGMLVVISVRKCSRRRASLRTARRNAALEVTWSATGEASTSGLAASRREPTPEEAAMLAETVSEWLKGLEPAERTIMELDLQGLTYAEIAARLRRSERTVRRVRQRVEERLQDLCRKGTD